VPPKITICIAARDEEAKIGKALESARACSWCDELLVMDTGSSDRTVAIATEWADRVEHHQWVNYSASKKQMTEMATNDWVFILDADEQISPSLAQEIANLDPKMFEGCSLITMPRENFLLGRYVRSWSPDRQNRLFDRRRIHWPQRALHDMRERASGDGHALRSPILHNCDSEDWADYFNGERYASRTEALAQEMYTQGRRVGLFTLWLRPWFAFVKHYVLKRGFLDGAFGLLIAQKAATSTQLKYARLLHLQMQSQDQTGD
jgi:(heptosyl)LPS beta-1,4-glucosyltransferase